MTRAIRKNLVICADDFGLTEAASKSIINLAGREAISATSCVVDGPFALKYARALLQSLQSCSVGVHLNLTENPTTPLNASLKTWLMHSFVLRSCDRAALAGEVTRQLDRFEALFDQAPHFVDGHEHVHQFPAVRDVLVELLLMRYGTSIAVRSTVPATHRGIKASIVAALGGRTLHSNLAQADIATNTDFAGVYDFTTRIPFAQRMRVWLQSIASGGLVMCHPERPTEDIVTLNSRNAEHRFFASPAWPALQNECHVRLVPFRHSLPFAKKRQT